MKFFYSSLMLGLLWLMAPLAQAQNCNPLSTLPCNEVVKPLPYNITFTGSEAGLNDKNGKKTGFTLALPHSRARLSADLPITNSAVNGYEPSRLTVTNGNLQILTNKGIAYLNRDDSYVTGRTNTQVNTLGVGFQVPSEAYVLQTTLVSPVLKGSSSQQGGLWVGLNDDNFIKLVLVDKSDAVNTIEFRKEVSGASGGSDGLNSSDIPVSSLSTLKLRLKVDPVAKTATAYYTIGSGSEQTLGTLSVPDLYQKGSTLGSTTKVLYGGVFGTHRLATNPVTLTFSDFSVTTSAASSTSQLVFKPTTLPLSYAQGFVPEGFSVSLTSTPSTTTATLSAVDPATNAVPTWLFDVNGKKLDGVNNEKYSTGITDVPFRLNQGLSPGIYKATIKASAPNFTAASLALTVEVTAASSQFAVNVNFSDQPTSAPSGYFKDYGQAYALRSASDQGSGKYSYGWIDPVTKAPLARTNQGRNRSTTGITDPVLATLVHMDNPYQTPSGYWEVAVPNGTYDVTVGVGDAAVGNATEIHRVNAEGVLIIENFVPFGPAGSATRFQSNTRQIRVGDGKLTLSFADGGINTKLTHVRVRQVTTTPDSETHPYVTGVTPTNNATGVSLTQSITVDIEFPNAVSLDVNTVNPQNVRLYRLVDGQNVLVTGTTVNATGGGDAITLSARLLENTKYTFEITSQVKDLLGLGMVPFKSTFTTGSDTKVVTDLSGIKFKEQILIDDDFGDDGFTGLSIGPDNRLYAVTSAGAIERWDIQSDGTLANRKTIRPFGTGKRLAINLTFDPAATATNLVAWLTHTTYGFQQMPDWGGKLSKVVLTNPDAIKVTDYLTNLPRSYKDHVTNGIDFGPDGALYFTQGSSSAMGAPDGAWGNRQEHLLTAAVLRLDVKALEASGQIPLNVKTEEGGTYNPYAPGSFLTIFATGVRNAYDLEWHSNGQLYSAANGSAAGGNVPAMPAGTIRYDGSVYSGPSVPGITNLRQTQKDFLFRIVQGGYYGHPNTKRKEYILNGGNPTAAKDPAEIIDGTDPSKGYPVGTMPEPHYRGFAYDFDLSKSPNGMIEYQSNAFNGKLKGKLLVCRFSGGDDIFILEPGGTNQDIVSTVGGDVYGPNAGQNGLRRPYANPLTLVEDVRNGNLYISEYFTGNDDGEPRITLLRPDVPATAQPALVADRTTLRLTDKTTAGTGVVQTVVLKNTGTASLKISGLTFEGTNASQFKLVNAPALPATVAAGGNLTLSVVLEASSVGNKKAQLKVSSNTSPLTVALEGIGHVDDEPSLQSIFNAYGLPVNSGDDNVGTAIIHSVNFASPILGEDADVPLFRKASGSHVSIELLGVFGPTGSNGVTTAFGWYKAGSTSSAQDLFTVSNADHTSMQPKANGATTFNPGTEAFGLFSRWPFFNNRVLYQEDKLNTFDGAIPHHVRVYPYREASGVEVPNTYIVAFEEHIRGYDYQDIVAVVRNVEPYAPDRPNLAFSPLSIDRSIAQGENLANQTVKLTTSGAAVTAQVVNPNVPWLKLSNTTLATGQNLTLSFNTTNLTPNVYYATVRATASGYNAATLNITLTVAGASTASSFSVNFQDEASVPPSAFLVDYGQPYGVRMGSRQGSGLSYGWVKPGTSTPLDLQGNGRNRGVSSDVVKETLMHMQYQNSNGASTSKGVLAEGAWEMAVPNGQYTITVTVGDTNAEGTANTRHVVNAEGIKVVDYTPAGKAGTVSGTATVNVSDGKLTLDARNGGFNTKVISTVISPQGTDNVGPVASMVVTGDHDQSGAYLTQATVTLSAAPQGSATSAKVVEYQINQGPPQPYTGPFVVQQTGSIAITAKSSDNNGNFSERTFPAFIIKSQVISGTGIAVENMTKFPKTQQGIPYDDRLVFLHIIQPRSTNKGIHNQNTLRIRNNGVNTLTISQLKLSHPAEFTFVNASPVKLPITISAGGYYDLAIKYLGRSSDVITVDIRTLEIISDAKNATVYPVTLACGLMPLSQGSNELDAQQIIDIFGLKTDMRQTLSNGSKTVRPSSDFPSADRVNSGKEGDLVLSKYFVRADASKPVEAYQMAAFRGEGTASIKLADVETALNTVGGFSFKFNQDYHQSLLPRQDGSTTQVAGTSSTNVNVPFTISASAYTTLGKNYVSGTPTVLGIRIYKVFDRNGIIRPNEYIVIQDYVNNGCGSGSANCDWNDNMYYFRNIRPQGVPVAQTMPTFLVKPGANFSFNAAAYFTLGYPGNKLTYSAFVAETAASLPSWLSINPQTGVISGTAPTKDGTQVNVAVNATDLNGLDVSGKVLIKVSGSASSTAARMETLAPTDSLMAGQLQIYPNPFTTAVDIVVSPDIATDVKLVLTDLTGRVLVEQAIPSEKIGDIVSWDLSGLGLNKGMYLLRLQSGAQILSVNRLMRE